MRKQFTKIFAIIFATFMFAGCSQRITDFTIISTKNVDLSKAGTFTRDKKRIVGEDVVHVIVIAVKRPELKEAIDNAIESKPGAVALVDGVVYYKYWSAVLYGQYKYVVEGTALIDPSMTSIDTDSNTDDYAVITLDNKGEVKSKKSITKEEFDAQKEEIKISAAKREIKNSETIN